MEYTFKINFETDGDFDFEFIPHEMKYDGYGNYSFSKTYSDYDTAIVNIKKICEFLKNNITGIDYPVENIRNYINDFLTAAEKKSEKDIFYIEKELYGNYEGTEMIFHACPKKINIELSLNDEEEALYKKNTNGVTFGDIHRAVMKLFENDEV